MDIKDAPFPPVWFAIGMDLPWKRGITYGSVPFKLLPTLDEKMFQGKFQWLPDLPEPLEPFVMMEDMTLHLDGLIQSAKEKNLDLPEAFITFFAGPAFQTQMVSSTDCYFDLSDKIIESPFDDGGFFILFIRDQQDVLLWYLYLHPSLGHGVVASSFHLNYLPVKKYSLQDIKNRTFSCAPTFEEFIYRFWIENMIRLLNECGLPLSKEQTVYLTAVNEAKQKFGS